MGNFQEVPDCAEEPSLKGPASHSEAFSQIDFMLKWTERCKATALPMATVRDDIYIYIFAVEQKMKRDKCTTMHSFGGGFVVCVFLFLSKQTNQILSFTQYLELKVPKTT